MTAEFHKNEDITLDGFDDDGMLGDPFQMVPLNGSRPMSVITENRPCALFFEKPAIAEMRNFTLNSVRQIGPEWGPNESIEVPPSSTLEFFIHGKSPGTVSLLLDDRDGKPFNLWVNVKAPLTVRCALLLLSDTVRATKRPVVDATGQMHAIHPIFQNQANVNLVLQASGSVVVATDLGNPLVLDYQPVKNGPLIFDMILMATPPAALSMDIIRVYCCWDVETTKSLNLKNPYLGDTVRRSCFIEDGQGPLTFAHEMGHALMPALKDYHNPNPRRLMFAHGPSFSAKLDFVEINSMNESGLS
jgi:hypothetical protein